jgi:hypothetical protein
VETVIQPLMAPRRLHIGPRRRLTKDACLSFGLRVLEPSLRPLRAPLPTTSRVIYERLIRAALVWGFDMPGGEAAWTLMQRLATQTRAVLTRWRTHAALPLGAQSGADRYAFAERLPAALIAGVVVDGLADLARYTVVATDGTTGSAHTWTVWQGALLPALLAWQTGGRLPCYEVTETHRTVWTPDRVAIAARLLPDELWGVLGKDLSRMVWSYIVDPHEPLTLVHRLVRDHVSTPIQHLDTLLAQCLQGTLRINTVPGHVFVLPQATFCAAGHLLNLLARHRTAPHGPGDAPDPETVYCDLRDAKLALPGRVALTIAPDATRPRPLTLCGFLIPHAVLHARCVQAGAGWASLPWAQDPPPYFAARIQLSAVTEEETTHGHTARHR